LEGALSSNKEHDRVLAIDKAMAELFYPQKMENRQTTEFCYELSVGVATTLLTELVDPKKQHTTTSMMAYWHSITCLLLRRRRHWALGQITIHHKATLHLSPMCYVIPGGYQLIVPQGLDKRDTTRI